MAADKTHPAAKRAPADPSGQAAPALRVLSGGTLSLILEHLRRANAGEIDAAACARLISTALTGHDAFVELHPSPGAAGLGANSARGKSIGLDALARLNVLLPWTSFNCLEGEGRILGSAWSPTKRSQAQPLPDKRVQRLNKLVPLRQLSVLEAGCFEGHHTASLAYNGAKVWAFDGRIENVIKTLVRLWALGLEHSARVELVDIEGETVSAQLKRLGRTEPFDLIHHRGVLYHLSRPVEHLADMAALCSRHIYLHTQIAREEQVNATHKTEFGDFKVFGYNEAERSYSPFSGMTAKAVWLTREGLFSALRRLGFADIQLLDEREERNGPRIELIATRAAAST